jgi:toxin ParE1/3/4
MQKVRLTQSAQTDLLEAWLYIAEENPQAADRLLDTIDREANTLALQPRMGRSRPELADCLRSWPTSTPYVLFYFADSEGIIVLRVLHHARDVQRVEFDNQSRIPNNLNP